MEPVKIVPLGVEARARIRKHMSTTMTMEEQLNLRNCVRFSRIAPGDVDHEQLALIRNKEAEVRAYEDQRKRDAYHRRVEMEMAGSLKLQVECGRARWH